MKLLVLSFALIFTIWGCIYFGKMFCSNFIDYAEVLHQYGKYVLQKYELVYTKDGNTTHLSLEKK